MSTDVIETTIRETARTRVRNKIESRAKAMLQFVQNNTYNITIKDATNADVTVSNLVALQGIIEAEIARRSAAAETKAINDFLQKVERCDL